MIDNLIFKERLRTSVDRVKIDTVRRADLCGGAHSENRTYVDIIRLTVICPHKNRTKAQLSALESVKRRTCGLNAVSLLVATDMKNCVRFLCGCTIYMAQYWYEQKAK